MNKIFLLLSVFSFGLSEVCSESDCYQEMIDFPDWSSCASIESHIGWDCSACECSGCCDVFEETGSIAGCTDEGTIQVPGDYTTIQEGLDAACESYTVR